MKLAHATCTQFKDRGVEGQKLLYASPTYMFHTQPHFISQNQPLLKVSMVVPVTI